MRDLWKFIEALKERKHLVSFKSFPGGHMCVAVYDSERQMEQYLYESKTGSYEEIEKGLIKDWGHILFPKTKHTSARSMDVVGKIAFPLPPGFPKPP